MSTLTQRIRTTALGVSAALALAAGSLTPTDGAHAAGQPTFDTVSDIQSKRWTPRSLYAAELIIVNSTDDELVLQEPVTWVQSGTWRKAPPKRLAVGERVNVLAEATSKTKGFDLQVSYRLVSNASERVTFFTKNFALQRNVYEVSTTKRMAVAVGDAWQNVWAPATDPRKTFTNSEVDSRTVGRSNWSVTAWDVGDISRGAGHALPRGQWSSGSCATYQRLMQEYGYNTQAARPADWWRDGAAGAQAGALLGWLVNGCAHS